MKLNIKRIKKSAIYLVLTIVGIYILVGLYSFVFEQDELKIDRYNFAQLEKAKPILESIPADAKKFFTLKEFNEQYNADIQPIENCYFIRNFNGNQKYIFGFQLKSKIYMLIYFGNSYSYPKYDMAYNQLCTGVGGSCSNDGNKMAFLNAILYPCD